MVFPKWRRDFVHKDFLGGSAGYARSGSPGTLLVIGSRRLVTLNRHCLSWNSIMKATRFGHLDYAFLCSCIFPKTWNRFIPWMNANGCSPPPITPGLSACSMYIHTKRFIWLYLPFSAPLFSTRPNVGLKQLPLFVALFLVVESVQTK